MSMLPLLVHAAEAEGAECEGGRELARLAEIPRNHSRPCTIATPLGCMTNARFPRRMARGRPARAGRGPWERRMRHLRQYMQTLTEAQWIAKAEELETRPPMPWDNIRA